MAREFCKHYQAMSDHDKCKIGIEYKSLQVNRTTDGVGFPCWHEKYKGCPSAIYPTPEEKAEDDRRLSEWLASFQTKLDNNICPHCDQPIGNKQQVGRCVYAYPCGCRLYQGKL